MALRYYANAPATSLAASCSAGATQIEVASTSGLPITYPYTLIIDRGEAIEEVVEVSNASGTTLTVTRGVDNTTAFAHASAASVVHGFSARDLREPNTHVNSTSNVHGTTSDVMGVSDIQTVTGKTLPMNSNSLTDLPPDTLLQANSAGQLSSTGVELATVLNPVGAVVEYAGGVAPSGWLICNGAAVSRITYADLFAVLGVTFGAGDGSTTFNIPDLRERSPRGVSVSETLGTAAGSDTVTLAVANLPPHDHGAGSLATASNGGHQHDLRRSNGTGTGSELARGTNSIDVTNSIPIVSNGAHTHNITGSTGNTGSGNAIDIQPKTLSLNFIIKT